MSRRYFCQSVAADGGAVGLNPVASCSGADDIESPLLGAD